jgi:predicted ATP-dependent serine protease
MATARDLYAQTIDHLPLPAAPDLRVGIGALVLVAGLPSAGKSTLTLKWLASIEGPVCMLSAEERLGPTLGARLQRLGIRRTDLTIIGSTTVDHLAEVLIATKARALLIDSVTATTMGPRELRQILTQTPIRALIGVVQVTKDGAMRGPNTLAHEADVLVEVVHGNWKVTKSRYQQIGLSGDVQFDS